ncbi:SsrA-binding protein SmpB [Candidatus Saccharibacteria bacterium]|nr:SsrA-binding protein SmpB [Candidatus Saccharibacteria bacterium]
MKSKKAPDLTTVNRRARYDYELGDDLSVGMSLSGPEVRSIRDNHVQLKGSFVTIRNGELWLNNLTLGSETARNIKLLATKSQIAELEKKKHQEGITIVPTKLLGGGRHIKLIIAIGKGKKKYDKRQTIKGRDLDREERRGLK